MEIRSITISYTKGKRKQINKRELEIKKILNDLQLWPLDLGTLGNISMRSKKM